MIEAEAWSKRYVERNAYHVEAVRKTCTVTHLIGGDGCPKIERPHIA